MQNRNCLAPWIADTTDTGPDGQQLNARGSNGNLLSSRRSLPQLRILQNLRFTITIKLLLAFLLTTGVVLLAARSPSTVSIRVFSAVVTLINSLLRIAQSYLG